MGSKKPAAPAAPKLTGALRDARSQAIIDLQRQAAGKGPSVTREQLKAAQERTLAAQLAAAQARPSRSSSGTMRQLIAERGATGRELAQAGAAGAAAEAQGARSTLVGITENELNRQAQMAGLEAQRQASIAQQQSQMTGALLGAAGTIGTKYAENWADAQKPKITSDERAKENKAPANKKMKSFLDALEAQQYNYKPETGLDRKKTFGIMAQDLEKSEVGRSMVKEVNGVKHVDMGRGFSAVLAAQAELNKRLDKLEKKD